MLKCAKIFSQIQSLANDRCKRETNYIDNDNKFISDLFINVSGMVRHHISTDSTLGINLTIDL